METLTRYFQRVSSKSRLLGSAVFEGKLASEDVVCCSTPSQGTESGLGVATASTSSVTDQTSDSESLGGQTASSQFDEWDSLDSDPADAYMREESCATAAEVPAAEPPLERVLRRYKQGDIFLCKAVGEALAYWRSSGLSLDDLEAALAAAETRVDAALAGGDCGRDDDACRDQRPAQDRRWSPTIGDAVSPDAKPISSQGLGIGGVDLFSAAHLMAHLRTAVAMMEQLEESKSWRQVATGGLQLWSTRDKQRDIQRCRANFVVEEPMLNIMCMAREVDLNSTWNPTTSEAKTLVQCGLGEFMFKYSIWVPWPFKEPQLFIRAMGMDLLRTEGCMLITLQDVGDLALPAGVDLGDGGKSRSRYRIMPSAMRLRPLAPNPTTGAPRLEATLVLSVDNGVALNETIKCFMLQAFGPLAHRSIVTSCRRCFSGDVSDSNPLVARQRERLDLYLSQALSIDRYLRSQGWAEQLPLLAALDGVASCSTDSSDSTRTNEELTC